MVIKSVAFAAAVAATLAASPVMAQSTTERSGTTTPPTTMERMPLTGPLSQAQLIEGLRAHGYDSIKLTTKVPDISDPHPELTNSVTSPDQRQAQITPVHLGWNGTAVKNGEPVNIYLRAEAPRNVAENVPGERRSGNVMVYLDHVQAGAR